MPGKTDTSPSTLEDSGDDEIASITSPHVLPNALDNVAPKMILPPQTWEMVLHSQPQTPNPEAVTLSLNAMQIQDTPMDDPTDRQSDTSSEATLSISVHIMKAYKGEPPMDNMVEWKRWRAPHLAIPSWMREELKKCKDVENVARTIRASVEWLDNTRIAQGSDNWPAFDKPLALLLDIYKTSVCPEQTQS